jgi:hypothetical protein
MTTRATVKAWVRAYLGTTIDDGLYGDTTPTSGVATVLDPIIQQAVDSLIAEIHQANPSYLSKSQTLAADSATARTYTFATQSVPLTDFARWLEVRETDADGALLGEVRLAELHDAGAGCFCVTGPDDTPVLQTSPDTTAGLALWLRYAYWPAALVDDTTAIAGIPSRFHDVIALEALFAFALGGEGSRPPELAQRWQDRRALLFATVAKRGIQPTQTWLQEWNP